MTTAAVEIDSVHSLVASYGDNPSAFLALNSGNEHFTAPGVEGVVVYRRAGRRPVRPGPGRPAGRVHVVRPRPRRRDPGPGVRCGHIRGGGVHGEPGRRVL